jgi:hypothetical protein
MADTSAPDDAVPTDDAAPTDGRTPSDRSAIEREVAAAGDDPTALQALKASFQTRISRRSDDFAATYGLTAVERRLATLGHGADPWDTSVRKLLR